MKTYEECVKELLIPLLGRHYKDTRDLTKFDSVLDFLPREVKSEISQFIEDLIPEEDNESQHHVKRKPKSSNNKSLVSLLEIAMDIGLDKDLIMDFILEKFKTSSLTLDNYSEFSNALQKLNAFFSLSELSSKMITYFFMINDEDDKWSDLVSRRKLKSTLIKNYQVFHNSKVEVMTELSEKGPLYLCGMITKCRVDSFEIAAVIDDFLRGVGSGEFTEGYDLQSQKDVLPLNSFQLNDSKVSALGHVLKSNHPVNILFEGTPGTGKTSLAFSLIKEFGLEPIYLKHEVEDGDDRRLALYAARRHAAQTGRILIIDEADDIISHKKSFFFQNSKDTDKAWINYFLDSSPAKIIWITNEKGNIEDSTSRRFSYILKFTPMNFIQRKNIWDNVVNKHNQQWIAGLAEYENIIRKYPLDAGSIDDAVFRAGSQGANSSFLLHYLEQKMEFLNGKRSPAEELRSNYNLDALNLSHSPQVILNSLIKFEQKKIESHNFNILLQGPSGTGKTEFVKYLGKELKKEVITKTASDILSKWVGEAEKNIAKAFKQAEAEEAILFLDEADSFFQAREGAERNWEITQVNEVLVQMERFKGILVCSTNFLKNFDKAAMRRFQYKVAFNFLTDGGKKLLFESYFPNLDFTKIAAPISRLNNVSPGDFKNVGWKLNYKESYTEEDVIHELTEEVSYKGKTRSLGLQV